MDCPDEVERIFTQFGRALFIKGSRSIAHRKIFARGGKVVVLSLNQDIERENGIRKVARKTDGDSNLIIISEGNLGLAGEFLRIHDGEYNVTEQLANPSNLALYAKLLTKHTRGRTRLQSNLNMTPLATTPFDEVDSRNACNRRLISINILSGRSGITRRIERRIPVHIRIEPEINVDHFIIFHRGVVHHIHDNLMDIVINLGQRRRLDGGGDIAEERTRISSVERFFAGTGQMLQIDRIKNIPADGHILTFLVKNLNFIISGLATVIIVRMIRR